jgi:hypothetical protein
MPLYARGPGCGACLFTFELGVTWYERLFAVLPRTAQHLNRADTNRCLTTVVLGSRGLMSIDMSRPNWGDASGAHCPYYLRLFSLCNAESPMERMLLATLNQRSHDDDITGYCCSLRRVVRLVAHASCLLSQGFLPMRWAVVSVYIQLHQRSLRRLSSARVDMIAVIQSHSQFSNYSLVT